VLLARSTDLDFYRLAEPSELLPPNFGLSMVSLTPKALDRSLNAFTVLGHS
jgi:hypothetical protein